VKFPEINAHRESSDFDDAIADGQMPHLVRIAENTLNAPEKIFPVVVRVESNKVGAEQTFKYSAAPLSGNQTKNLELRKRNVQEKTNPDFRCGFSEEMRQ
jgi:hypothetical protein